MLKIFVIFIVILGAVWKQDALLSFVGLTNKESPTLSRSGSAIPVKVITQQVEITPNDQTFRAIGTGRARLSIGIYAAVADKVTGIYFTAQQTVKKDDLLIQLDNRDELLSVRLAEVQLKDAQRVLNRFEQIVSQGGVPRSEVDAARADFEIAQVELEKAKLALNEQKITAPFDGVVGLPSIDVGDRVNPDRMITSLDARDLIYVDFEVPESLAGVLQSQSQNNKQIEATTPAFPSMVFVGNISAQESRVNPERRTLKARAVIDNPDDFLRPGMSFETRWTIRGDNYASVPEISVQWAREGAYIWLIREELAEKISVKVVGRKAGRVLLEGAIHEGDSVVIEGLQRLRPGKKVDVLGKTAS